RRCRGGLRLGRRARLATNGEDESETEQGAGEALQRSHTGAPDGLHGVTSIVKEAVWLTMLSPASVPAEKRMCTSRTMTAVPVSESTPFWARSRSGGLSAWSDIMNGRLSSVDVPPTEMFPNRLATRAGGTRVPVSRRVYVTS